MPDDLKIEIERENVKEEQRRRQDNEIGPNYIKGLGNREIVSPYYLEKELFLQINFTGIDNLFYQEWESVYICPRKRFTNLL